MYSLWGHCSFVYSCSVLDVFHKYLQNIVQALFENWDSNTMSTVRYEKIMFLGQSGTIKGVNVYFLNFIFSIARFCIFKRRNVLAMKNEHLDIRFFKYTWGIMFHTFICIAVKWIAIEYYLRDISWRTTHWC